MRNATGIHFTQPAHPLDVAAREQLADALHAAGSPASVYVRVVDADWEPRNTELDLIVQTTNTRTAREIWAAWALEQDLDGSYRVEVRLTSPLLPGRKRRDKETAYAANVDLDMILLDGDLAEVAAADRALGL